MRWTVLYDGSCPLCQSSAERLKRLDRRGACDLVDGRDPDAAGAAAPSLTPEELGQSLHVLRSDGRLFRGFYAVRELLRLRLLGRLVRPLLFLPGVPAMGERLYAAVARRRHRPSPPPLS